jgi:hypothetical protein
VKSISSRFLFVVPRLCNVAQPFLLSDEQIISLIYLPQLLKRVPRVCKVAQPLFFVEKQRRTPVFPLSQGCANLPTLYFLSKNNENANCLPFQGNFAHLFLLPGDQISFLMYLLRCLDALCKFPRPCFAYRQVTMKFYHLDGGPRVGNFAHPFERVNVAQHLI